MQHKGWHSRGYLPHLDAPGELQALTFRLHDAVPLAVIERWRRELSQETESVRERELNKRIARYEDAGLGDCLLRRSEYAGIVQDCLFHSDGTRYRLLEWSIMPNHVHVLIDTLPGKRLGDLVRAWKTYSAKLINEGERKSGSIWAEDYHDRFIRDLDHLENARLYIRKNPVKAGLCTMPEEWPWSSASRDRGIPGARADADG